LVDKQRVTFNSADPGEHIFQFEEKGS
jgi:hypothetical protein